MSEANAGIEYQPRRCFELVLQEESFQVATDFLPRGIYIHQDRVPHIIDPIRPVEADERAVMLEETVNAHFGVVPPFHNTH
jgi:hypothetical protein